MCDSVQKTTAVTAPEQASMEKTAPLVICRLVTSNETIFMVYCPHSTLNFSLMVLFQSKKVCFAFISAQRSSGPEYI